MIIIYPMLTSSTVSTTVTPGIAKAVEKFIIVYRLDELLKKVKFLRGVAIGMAAKGTGAMLSMKEQEEIENNIEDYFWTEQPRKGQPPPTPMQKAGQAAADITKASGQQAHIVMGDMQSISLEPTWMKVDTLTGPQLLGVKVIPFPVKSDTGLASLLMSDTAMKSLQGRVESMRRKTARLLSALARGFKLPAKLGGGAVSGDPKKDVLFGRTVHGRHIFVNVNFMDLQNEIFKSAGGVRRLHKLGWTSLIATDEVNKRVMFCMKEFKGLCSIVPLNYLYASLGRDQYKAYGDLDDVRKAASPFFSMRKNMNKLLGEGMASSKLVRYSETEAILEHADLIQEGFGDWLRKLKPKAKRASDEIESTVSAKNKAKAEKILSGVPKVPIENVKKMATKLAGPQFKRNYELSKRVIKNSIPKATDKLVDSMAVAAAFKGTYKSKDPAGDTKVILQELIPEIRKGLPAALAGAGAVVALTFITKVMSSAGIAVMGVAAAPYFLAFGIFLILAMVAATSFKKEPEGEEEMGYGSPSDIDIK